ncbi:reprolysin-like metallopeptidase [Psychroserpens sp. SPM9]|uniref:zinc-dependent metalloprotease n=1 Tax=Psychroserpens sp. SPM9 TaxID=2975598 RepID=UPI0021A702EF|nr:T9SS type A sorting domain-containing protein [Psychroserpens sp. SPM9]MDG5491016.1 M12 family metallo-peptidase [Psychroserpens sp. SPM9]
MKKNTLKRHILFVVCLSFCFSALAQKNQWKELSSDTQLSQDKWQRDVAPSTSKLFSLNLENIKDRLANVPSRKEATISSGVLLDFPNAEGALETYSVLEASVMHPELQERYPDIRSYVGQNVDKPYITIRFSISYKGLNAIILNSELGSQHIDCLTKDQTIYQVYKIKDVPVPSDAFACYTEDEGVDLANRMPSQNDLLRNADDGTLREYNLALGCTQEYADYHVTEAGLNMATDAVKKAAILAIMNDMMTRVNAVYETDLSVTMTLIPTNENIIFLTDTFLSNDNLNALIDESRNFLPSLAGSTFEIGHMLADTSGGLAYVSRVCDNSFKAGAASGRFGVPSGLVHENIIRHEMGHQYGALHTYNSNNCAGPSTPSTAYEPGSGTTTMSYAGICGPSSNVIATNDLYFHQISLQQIWANIDSGAFDCSTNTPNNNALPTVEAGANYIIPIGTPFKLTGVSNDADGIESHTYCWEQFDLGPSISNPGETTMEGPVVRSFSPSPSPTRYIPRLEDVVANGGNSTAWEKLMLIARDLNFRLTVRDNGVNGGQTVFDGMTVTTAQTGFFRVTSQNTNGISYDGATTQTVTWNVAGTTGSGINTSQVNILLSVDGGVTFDTILLENTDNDGSADVVIPNGINSTECRIIVEAVGNIFYNINQSEFEIESTLSVDDQNLNDYLTVYPNPNKGEFNIKYTNGFNEGLQIEIYDIRGRSILSKTFDNTGDFNETIKIPNATSGVYIIRFTDGDQKGIKKLVIQ